MFKQALLTLACLSVWCGSAFGLPLGALVHDGPPTPEQISLFLPVTGSLPQTATATVRYKPTGSGTFITGHPLYRVRPSLSETPAVGSVVDAFAWPIIDLTPGTSYDVEVTVCDGSTCDLKTGTFTTRSLPPPAGAANKIIAAGSSTATIQTALNGLNPGDVIQFQDGTYNLSSSLTISRSGTATSPIYIRGASRAGVILSNPGDIIRLAGVFNVILENFSMRGSGVDGGIAPGNSSLGIRFNDSTTNSAVTIRNVTMTGVDRAIGPAVTAPFTATQIIVYNNTLIGNNQWTSAWTDTNLSWDDDGINLAGQGNVAFNNTLQGFGDSLSYASNTGTTVLTQAIGVHYYRNDIIHGEDDGTEADYAIRNNTFYDNRLTNTMTCLSLDPVYGGPFLFARNVCINSGRQPFKWNSTNSGQFVYSNTIVHTTTRYATTDPPAESGWYQANNGDQNSLGYRNNILVYRGNGTRTIRLDNATSSWTILDFDHNSWFPNATFQWPSGAFASLSAAQSGLASTTPVFSGLTRRHDSDNITVSNPWTDTITLGSDYHTQVTVSYVPILLPGSAPKNSGVAIANITDGFTGSAPDRGAIISGRVIPKYGDISETSQTTPSSPTGLRLTSVGFMLTFVSGALVVRSRRRKA